MENETIASYETLSIFTKKHVVTVLRYEVSMKSISTDYLFGVDTEKILICVWLTH